MKPPTRLTLLISTRRISIAHFSTSHSHYSSRRHEEEARNVRVSVWWDVESCCLPVGGSSGYRVAHSITNALRANGIKGPLQITAFGNVFKLPRSTQEAVSSTGINLLHVPGGQEGVNRSMIIELMYWAMQHPPPAHIFVVSGDCDVASILHRLRMSNYNILLAGPENASTALCSAASIMWQWDKLVKGEDLVGKHFNQPPDGSNGSWYGTYRVPLENVFPTVEQPLPLKDSEPAESENENVICDIPAEVTDQIRRILTTYPKGLSLTTLRRELGSTGLVDKKLYGYKNFSSLLLAMPQIVKLHPRDDGQHLVCAATPTGHIFTDSPSKASEKSIADDPNCKSPTQTEVFDEKSIADDTNCMSPPTQTEVFDEKSSLKAANDLNTLDSCFAANEKSKPTEPGEQSSLTCDGKPLMNEGCQGPSTKEIDVEQGSDYGSAPDEKQDKASENGFFRRTWTKWFCDANDIAVKKELTNSDQHGPSSEGSRICDASPMESSYKTEYSDRGVAKILKFCNRVLYGLDKDGPDSESAASECSSSYGSSQVVQSTSGNDNFLTDSFWTELKSFIGSPEGLDVVSKSKSRLHMARAMKREGPSVLNSFGDDDLLHLVNLLIDDKNWIKEYPSQTSPFKVFDTNLLENSNDPIAMNSILSDKHQQAGLQTQGDCVREPPKQIPIVNQHLLEEKKTRMLSDCQKLLNAIVKSHPRGFNVGGFKKLFFDRYGYHLHVRYLEFDKLTSLIKTMSGVKLKVDIIYPSENFSSSAPGSSSTDLFHGMNRMRRFESNNEMSVSSSNLDSTDSQFDEQLGPVRSINKNAPSSLSGKQKPKTDEYEPCAEDDIYTDSDGETRTNERQAGGRVIKVHNEVSSLIDILSNWEARKDSTSKNNLSENTPNDTSHYPIKTHTPSEVSGKSYRGNALKSKPPKTYNFVADDLHKEAGPKNSTEPGQQC